MYSSKFEVSEIFSEISSITLVKVDNIQNFCSLLSTVNSVQSDAKTFYYNKYS